MTFGSPQINLYTDDVARLRAFYASLGFHETFRHPATGTVRHVEMTLDGFTLGIADADAARADHGLTPDLGGHRVELVLTSTDTDADVARLTAAGAPALSAPHDWLGRLRVAWIADPDGNPIQLVQTKAVAPAAPTAAAPTQGAPTAPTTPPNDTDDLALPQSPLPADYYTAGGTPTFDAVAERIHRRAAMADGNEVLDSESDRGRHETDDVAALKRAGQDRLAQLRRSMGFKP